MNKRIHETWSLKLVSICLRLFLSQTCFYNYVISQIGKLRKLFLPSLFLSLKEKVGAVSNYAILVAFYVGVIDVFHATAALLAGLDPGNLFFLVICQVRSSSFVCKNWWGRHRKRWKEGILKTPIMRFSNHSGKKPAAAAASSTKFNDSFM